MEVKTYREAMNLLLPDLDRYGLSDVKREVQSVDMNANTSLALGILVKYLVQVSGAVPSSPDAVRLVLDRLLEEGEDEMDWDAQLACRELLRRAGVPEDEIPGSDE
ncbi:MAG: hypothetical protein PUF51_07270 [Bifidobacteriaceae bacterium]|jgi:hypothetical protein|nr:hypothetical protein [Bifidobacteriaceae bacterium]